MAAHETVHPINSRVMWELKPGVKIQATVIEWLGGELYLIETPNGQTRALGKTLYPAFILN
jgi:hypothetical protein